MYTIYGTRACTFALTRTQAQAQAQAHAHVLTHKNMSACVGQLTFEPSCEKPLLFFLKKITQKNHLGDIQLGVDWDELQWVNLHVP